MFNKILTFLNNGKKEDRPLFREKGSVPLFILLTTLTGCSVINFSGNYYTLPGEVSHEINAAWREIMTGVPVKNSYKYTIVSEKAGKGLKGIPAISDNVVILPENYLKYIYQNYYEDRRKILTSTIVHEICHREYGLASSPPGEHFKTDARAVALLGGSPESADTYYKSLYVLKNYWFARKGVAGHSLNAGWNLVNAASVALGGPGVFMDWFGTDLNQRMKLLRKNYRVSGRPFPRSTQKLPAADP